MGQPPGSLWSQRVLVSALLARAQRENNSATQLIERRLVCSYSSAHRASLPQPETPAWSLGLGTQPLGGVWGYRTRDTLLVIRLQAGTRTHTAKSLSQKFFLRTSLSSCQFSIKKTLAKFFSHTFHALRVADLDASKGETALPRVRVHSRGRLAPPRTSEHFIPQRVERRVKRTLRRRARLRTRRCRARAPVGKRALGRAPPGRARLAPDTHGQGEHTHSPAPPRPQPYPTLPHTAGLSPAALDVS